MKSKVTKEEILVVVLVAVLLFQAFRGLVGQGSVDLFKGKLEHHSMDDRAYVGVVLKAEDSEHWWRIREGAEAAGEDLGIRVSVLAPDRESYLHQQHRMIEDLILAGIDALCVAPADSTDILPVLADLRLKGIKVITLDTNTSDSSQVQGFVGSDNYSAGVLAGLRMIKQLKGQGRVLVMTGLLSQQTHIDRLTGFVDTVEASDMEIVATLEADSDYELAYERMSEAVDVYGDFDGCFITSGLMTMGAVEALESKEGIDPLVIGVDVQKELLQLIDEGYVDSVVSQSPYEMGYKAVAMAVRAINGEAVDPYQKTSSVLVTKESLRAYLQGY